MTEAENYLSLVPENGILLDAARLHLVESAVDCQTKRLTRDEILTTRASIAGYCALLGEQAIEQLDGCAGADINQRLYGVTDAIEAEVTRLYTDIATERTDESTVRRLLEKGLMLPFAKMAGKITVTAFMGGGSYLVGNYAQENFEGWTSIVGGATIGAFAGAGVIGSLVKAFGRFGKNALGKKIDDFFKQLTPDTKRDLKKEERRFIKHNGREFTIDEKVKKVREIEIKNTIGDFHKVMDSGIRDWERQQADGPVKANEIAGILQRIAEEDIRETLKLDDDDLKWERKEKRLSRKEKRAQKRAAESLPIVA